MKRLALLALLALVCTAGSARAEENPERVLLHRIDADGTHWFYAAAATQDGCFMFAMLANEALLQAHRNEVFWCLSMAESAKIVKANDNDSDDLQSLYLVDIDNNQGTYLGVASTGGGKCKFLSSVLNRALRETQPEKKQALICKPLPANS